MMKPQVLEMLFVEIHNAIAASARKTVDRIGDEQDPPEVAYPPGERLAADCFMWLRLIDVSTRLMGGDAHATGRRCR
jgi:hypothetical protein